MRMAAIMALLACLAAAPSPKPSSGEPMVRPEARVQTVPTPHQGDSADDPAIWIHPTRPELSLILGTDKQGGLHVYDMDGRQIQVVSSKCHPNNVDVLYNYSLDGKPTDLAVASTRDPSSVGVKVWSIDPDTRMLTDITRDPAIAVMKGSVPYGLCTYRSPRSGKYYFFVNDYNGRVEQYLLQDFGGKIDARLVRTLKLKSITEGCVVDDELGYLYMSEERVGIWKFNADPDAGDDRKLIAKVGEHALAADVEGLTIYSRPGGKGYLIASSQGNNTFKIYERQGENRFLLTINPNDGKIDDVSDTDGIAVTNCPTSERFPKGFLVVQDGVNKGGNQNFKIYAWEDIASDRLSVDTTCDPRHPAVKP
jgi:3-phytase